MVLSGLQFHTAPRAHRGGGTRLGAEFGGEPLPREKAGLLVRSLEAFKWIVACGNLLELQWFLWIAILQSKIVSTPKQLFAESRRQKVNFDKVKCMLRMYVF